AAARGAPAPHRGGAPGRPRAGPGSHRRRRPLPGRDRLRLLRRALADRAAPACLLHLRRGDRRSDPRALAQDLDSREDSIV
ncbi:MAG: hypothetical protein AVDCRST_MAG45-2038, partial [uncultured Solirubrobacterales bacterium]